MSSKRAPVLFLALAAGLTAFACMKKEAPAPAAEVKAPPPGGGKIPITTASADAKAEFVQGRDKVDKLLITDSIQHFQKAVSLDPNFAWAELALANAAPSGKEFFEHLNKAVSLADKASDGERLMILATQAGANNNAVKQKEYLEQLVKAYPEDERAHFNLGGYYFGQQDFTNAIEQYRKATEIAPNFSSAYNLLGYAFRQNGDYANAEKAFQKYIELIPKDPNPYDSYGELLLKMGRYDDSIVQYRKALAIEPNFVASYQGIAMDQLYSGKPDLAAAEIKTLSEKARTDGERRGALFASVVIDTDGGKYAKALETVAKSRAIAEKNNDVPGMVFDSGLKANLLLESGKPDAAKAEYEASLKLVEGSNLSQEIKDNAKLVQQFNLARVALAKKDFAGAKKEAEAFRQGAAASKNPFQQKLPHELDGQIALAEKSYDKAIEQLNQANQQNPYNLYRLCQAYDGKGDKDKAREYCAKAANFNVLPNQNLAYVRSKAKAVAEKKG